MADEPEDTLPMDPVGRPQLRPGDRHYRAFVGPPERYDLMAANQFCLLVSLGMREHHRLLDVGCGSLRGGRLFLPYLLPGNYHGIEPEKWLVHEGIEAELGRDIIRVKKPRFDHNPDFNFGVFGREFDYIVAQSIFSHAAPAQVRTCIAEARKVMGPESVFVANFLPGTSDHQGSAWTYPRNVTYTYEFMVEAARSAALVALPLEWPTPRLQWLLFGVEERRDRVGQLADEVGAAGLRRRLEAAERRIAELEAEARRQASPGKGLGAHLRRLACPDSERC